MKNWASRRKAYILKIGEITEEGRPENWHFGLPPSVEPLEVLPNGEVIYCGYTVDELKMVSELGFPLPWEEF